MEDIFDNSTSILNILLQFKHMLLFLNEHCSEEIEICLNDLSHEFSSNIELCLKLFNELLSKNSDDELVKFIRGKEMLFGKNKKLYIIDRLGNVSQSVLMKEFKKTQLESISTKKNDNVNKSISNEIKTVNIYKKKNKFKEVCSSTKEQQFQKPLPDCQMDILKESSKLCTSNGQIEVDEPEENDSCGDIFGISIRYSCSVDGCRYRGSTVDMVKAHEFRIHSQKIFKCNQNNCELQFASIYDFDKHMIDVHAVFKCTVEECSKEFPDKYKLKKHIKEEHKQEYLTCKICNKMFPHRNGLRKHIYVKHEFGEFKCDYQDCSFTAKFRRELENHKNFKHKLEKCSFPGCGRLISKYHFKQHMKIHQKIKSHCCSWPDCGKSFADSKSLKDHVRVHLNFKRYRCKWPDCGYACEQQSNLITHVRVRHFKLPQTKKKQMELNIPSEAFPDPYNYLEICNEDILLK